MNNPVMTMPGIIKQIITNPASDRYQRLWKERYAGRKYGLLFLGAGLLQIPGILAAKAMGIYLCAADGNPDAPGASLADEFFPVDLKDVSGLETCAAKLKHEGKIHGVLTIGTDFSASVAYVADACGFPGIGYEHALDASRKHRMRKVFSEAGLPQPQSVNLNIDSEDRFESCVSELKYPLVVKPVDNMGARGVRLIRNQDELGPAIEQAYNQSREKRIIIEEKITGSEYSLDALIDRGRLYPTGIARRHVEYPPVFIERGHSFPCDVDETARRQMFDLLLAAADALGVKSGAVKGDIFYGPDGPLIGEVAARLSGGFMSGWTFPMSSGVNPAIGAIQIALGQELIQDFDPGYFTSVTELPVNERGLISVPGTVSRIVMPENLPEEVLFFPSVSPGSRVNFPRNNVEKCGNLIAPADGRQTEELLAKILVLLKPAGIEGLRLMFAQEYPPAYTKLFSTVKSDLSSRALVTSGPDQSSGGQYVLPAYVIGSEERDWNYRSIHNSLGLIKRIIPDFTWLADADPQKRIPGSGRSLAFLLCLLAGGAQAAIYYLELEKKNTENCSSEVLEIFGVYSV